MKIEPLSNNEALQGYTHKITLLPSDLTQSAANTPQTINLIPVVLGQVITRVATLLITPFQNSTDATFNTTAITIGDGGVNNRYIASQELNANGAYVSAKAGATMNAYTAADNLAIVFNSMAAKSLNSIDTGKLVVLVHLSNLNVL